MMALFPEHELTMLDVLPKTAPIEPKEFDAMVVDIAALLECDSLTGRDLKLLQGCDIPLVLIGADDSAEIAEREKLVRITRPVTKESLQRALADCLSGAAPLRAEIANPAEPAIKPKAKARKPKVPAPAHPAINYIELVDVVEEGDATVARTVQAQKKF
jgi:hypothetical protein